MSDLIASYKEDFDENNTLQAPFVRNGYVYYVCTSVALESRTDKLEMIATHNVTHSRGRTVLVYMLYKRRHVN